MRGQDAGILSFSPSDHTLFQVTRQHAGTIYKYMQTVVHSGATNFRESSGKQDSSHHVRRYDQSHL